MGADFMNINTETITKDAKDSESLANSLIEESTKLGSTDNISCIVIALF